MSQAKIANPRKQFQFRVTIPGLEQFLVQRITLPTIDLEQVSHGDTNYEVKTGGRKMVGNLTLSKISRSERTDYFFRNWARRVQNTNTGGGQLPSQYKTTILVDELSADGETIIDTHTYDGCWPTKLNGVELNRMGSDNTVQEIEFSVDDERL